ncbi:hypothetical protein GHH_c02000 [Geobacillus sp. GHH01]|nr:hypothetical protein GHH_c02000 [Geobacillus sp. GHH01]KZE94663.1 hypothetical protein AVP43_02570 [Geobacillus stearothermophilus]
MFLIPEHQERYEHFLKPLYGMLLEISWLLRLLQYQFFACGVKTECELPDKGEVRRDRG